MANTKILIVEPFFTGSHKTWALQLQTFLPYETEIISLSGANWKWRMEGGALALAEEFKKRNLNPDIIIASSMLNLTLFQALIKKPNIIYCIYMHENQITYPVSPKDNDKAKNRDGHYGFMQLTSCFSADKIVFNSHYNFNSFCEEGNSFIKKLPDFEPKNIFEVIQSKSSIIYPGIDPKQFIPYLNTPKQSKTLLWNHRWEHDKNTEGYLQLLDQLVTNNVEFKLVFLGKGTEKKAVQDFLINKYGERIIHIGYVESQHEYLNLVASCAILPVTSYHDFFGISVAEATALGVQPILPERMAYPEHQQGSIIYYKENNLYDIVIEQLQNPNNSQKKINPSFELEFTIKQWVTLIEKMTPKRQH